MKRLFQTDPETMSGRERATIFPPAPKYRIIKHGALPHEPSAPGDPREHPIFTYREQVTTTRGSPATLFEIEEPHGGGVAHSPRNEQPPSTDMNQTPDGRPAGNNPSRKQQQRTTVKYNIVARDFGTSADASIHLGQRDGNDSGHFGSSHWAAAAQNDHLQTASERTNPDQPLSRMYGEEEAPKSLEDDEFFSKTKAFSGSAGHVPTNTAPATSSLLARQQYAQRSQEQHYQHQQRGGANYNTKLQAPYSDRSWKEHSRGSSSLLDALTQSGAPAANRYPAGRFPGEGQAELIAPKFATLATDGTRVNPPSTSGAFVQSATGVSGTVASGGNDSRLMGEDSAQDLARILEDGLNEISDEQFREMKVYALKFATLVVGNLGGYTTNEMQLTWNFDRPEDNDPEILRIRRIFQAGALENAISKFQQPPQPISARMLISAPLRATTTQLNRVEDLTRFNAESLPELLREGSQYLAFLEQMRAKLAATSANAPNSVRAPRAPQTGGVGGAVGPRPGDAQFLTNPSLNEEKVRAFVQSFIQNRAPTREDIRLLQLIYPDVIPRENAAVSTIWATAVETLVFNGFSPNFQSGIMKTIMKLCRVHHTGWYAPLTLSIADVIFATDASVLCVLAEVCSVVLREQFQAKNNATTKDKRDAVRDDMESALDKSLFIARRLPSGELWFDQEKYQLYNQYKLDVKTTIVEARISRRSASRRIQRLDSPAFSVPTSTRGYRQSLVGWPVGRPSW